MLFVQDACVLELYSGTDNRTTAPATVLYLLPRAGQPAPASIDFADSWDNYAGTYIFLQTPLVPGTEVTFAASMRSFLADSRIAGTRFAWIIWPDTNQPVAGTAVPVASSALAFQVIFEFRNVSLVMWPGVTVAIDATNVAFRFNQGTGQGARPTTLVAGWGAMPLPNAVAGDVRLPFTGRLAGTLCFPVSLAKTGGIPDLDTLDVGLRMFYANPSSSGDGGFFLDSLRYPVVATEQGALSLYAALDPLAPLDGARTFFAFNAADCGLTGPPAPPVPSHFRSTLGRPLQLVPFAEASATTGFARLVFAERPASSPAGPAEPLYLVPQGDFGVDGGPDMMCGLSGVEYVGLSGSGDTVSFFPGAAAFADGFLPGQPPGATTLQPAEPPTTAFAAVAACSIRSSDLLLQARPPPEGPSRELTYFAQPDQAVLFNYGAQQAPGVTTLPALSPLAVEAASLPWPPTLALCFPLFPYAGVVVDSDTAVVYQQMESQVASPLRRRSLAAAPPRGGCLTTVAGTTRPASRYSTTPQGLLATYTPGAATWDEIVLGKMINGAQLLLSNVSGALLAAFQSNKLFLVVSDPASIASALLPDTSQIAVGGDSAELWNFDLSPASWSKHGTIFIIKFADMSIVELAADTGTWASPEKFNVDPSATAAALTGICAGVDDPDFKTFHCAVNDRQWNGILALNVHAPLDELPAQLAGLAAGIDPGLFAAHHVGITASRIVTPPTPGALSIADSSIFGLINYLAPAPLLPIGGDYQFQVAQLKVLFLNSAVAGFSSVIDLQINALFGEAASLSKPQDGDNVVQMYGVYQKHEVNGQTQDSYAFRTKSGAPSVFDMTSGVLRAVQLSGGQFITVSPTRSSWPLGPAGTARESGIVILQTGDPHGMAPGDSIRVAGVSDDSFDGTFAILAVPSPAQLTYAQPGAPDAVSSDGRVAATRVVSEFVFWGVLDFRALDGFDAFSFGREQGSETPSGLGFGHLVIAMTFDDATPALIPTFTFDARTLSVDQARSVAREGSFFSHFPLTVAGLTQAQAGTTPAGAGYMSVQSPLVQSSLQSPWFSLVFDLDLGSPGALAAQSGFIASVAVAWSPSTTGDYAMFLGFKLPGSSGSKRSISIEGIFDITFKTLEIVALPDTDAYILVLYDIGFRFLRFSFPPTGQVNFTLFGDPGQSGGGTTLGWYAAYAKPAKQGGATQVPPGSGWLPSGISSAQPTLLVAPVATEGE